MSGLLLFVERLITVRTALARLASSRPFSAKCYR